MGYWSGADGLAVGPYRFYFYSHEPNEPPHVHIDRDGQSAKFWLSPIRLALNLGFNPPELRRIQRLLTENESLILERWNEEFGSSTRGYRVKDVHITDDTLAVDLIDGRTIIVPLVWYRRLLGNVRATEQLEGEWRRVRYPLARYRRGS